MSEGMCLDGQVIWMLLQTTSTLEGKNQLFNSIILSLRAFSGVLSSGTLFVCLDRYDVVIHYASGRAF